MTAVLRLPRSVLERTFAHFRECGQGRRECQALWIGPWTAPETVTDVVHPKHAAHVGGFVVDDRWLTDFWLRLSKEKLGVRAQVHTHPGEAFHSKTDDDFPIVHSIGFLSLVIPHFARGAIGFDDAYLAEIRPDATWREVPISSRLVIQ